jgi:hypothetical protein
MFLLPGSRAKPRDRSIKLLNTLTASNSPTLGDLSSLTKNFSIYEIVLFNCVPSVNAVTAQIQIHAGGIFQTTNYNSFGFMIGSPATQIASAASASTFILSYTNNIANSLPGVSGTVRIYKGSAPFLNSFPTYTAHMVNGVGAGGIQPWLASGWWTGGTALPPIDGFQFYFSGGVNIGSGTIRVYGIS